MNAKSEITEYQRKTWNKFAPGWKKWDEFVMAWLKPIGDAILTAAVISDSQRILDIACGTGEPGLTAARHVGAKGSVIGTDLAEEMVTIARSKASALGIMNYEARKMDAAELPFPDGEFDAVICRHGIMFCADTDNALKEFSRVLRPSGRLSISAWAPADKNPWATTAMSNVGRILKLPPPDPEAPGLFRCARPGFLTELFGKAGLENLKQQQVDGEVVYESAEEYWQFVTDVVAPVVAALAQSDETTRKSVAEAVVQDARRFLKDGRVRFSWSAWVISGEKKK